MSTIDVHNAECAYNASLYKAYETNRWRFFEEMSPSEGACAGFLLKSPIPVMIATVSYILFVCVIGPFLMKNREPFQLKNLIRFYNLFEVGLAGILFFRLYDSLEAWGNLLDCQKTFTFDDASGTKIYNMANFIMMVRLSEYLDTIFFTLRKKQSQVTFLHVFHHAFVPMYAFWILKTGPLRFNAFIILVNSLIHVLMYFYYFLATFQQPRDASGTRKPAKQGLTMYIITKLLMFKKYMTQLQIIQFVALAFYVVWAIFQPNRCGVPWVFIFSNLFVAFMFLSLFVHFYVSAYKSARDSAARAKRE